MFAWFQRFGLQFLAVEDIMHSLPRKYVMLLYGDVRGANMQCEQPTYAVHT